MVPVTNTHKVGVVLCAVTLVGEQDVAVDAHEIEACMVMHRDDFDVATNPR